MTASSMSPRLLCLSDFRQTIKRNSHEIYDGAFSGTDRAGFERVRQTDCRESCGGGYSSRPGAGRPDRRHRIDRITDDHLSGRVHRSISSRRNTGSLSRFAHQFAEQSESTRGHDQTGGVHRNAKAGSGGRRIIRSIAPAQIKLQEAAYNIAEPPLLPKAVRRPRMNRLFSRPDYSRSP